MSRHKWLIAARSPAYFVVLACISFAIACSSDSVTGPDSATDHAVGTITIVSGGDQHVGPGEAVPASPVVSVTSDRGRPLQGATLSVTPDAESGSVAATSVVTNEKGEATLPRWEVPLNAGTFYLTISSAAAASSPAVTVRVSAIVDDQPIVLVQKPIGTTGGTVTVTRPGSPLSGLTITVPPASFAGATANFTVSSRPASTSPANTSVVSPLIDISDGDLASDSVIEIRIPAVARHGGTRVAFVIGANNKLIPVGLKESDASSVTVGIHSFAAPSAGVAGGSALSSVSATPGVITLFIREWLLPSSGVVSIGFVPGTHNAGFVNRGSFWASGGYCAGSTVLAGAQFLQMTAGSSSLSARARFPALMTASETGNWRYADQLNPAIRLATALQEQYGYTNSTIGQWRWWLGQSNQSAWENILSQMYFDASPVYLAIFTADKQSGHAILAYRVDIDQGRIYVADPNFPDNQNRYIEYSGGHFAPFPAAPNAEADATSYTWFAEATYFFASEKAAAISSIFNQFVSGGGLRSTYAPVAGRVKLKSNEIVSADGDVTSINAQTRDSELRFVSTNISSYVASWVNVRNVDASGQPIATNTSVAPNDTLRIPLQTGQNRIGVVFWKNPSPGLNWYDAKLLVVTRAVPALKFLIQPSSQAAGAPLSVKVGLVDEDGNLVPESRVIQLTLAGGAAGAVLSNGTLTTAADGTANFTGLTVDRAGTGYTLVASSSGLTSVTSNSFNITGSTGSLVGRVFNAVSSAAVANASIDIRNSSGTLVGHVTTNAAGEWTAAGLAAGTYRIDVSATGFVSTTVTSQVLTLPSTIVEPIPLVPAATPGGISGSLFRATDNALITTSATVELRAGINSTTGATTATLQTSNGSYQFTNVAAGVYTVVAHIAGYTDGARTGIVVGAGSTRTGQDVVLNPSAAGGTARVVLTWGATPEDLDSHMTGPVSGQATRFWVYYASRGSCSSSPFACLDVDDVTSFGPETITISQVVPGTYRYYVYNFSDLFSGASTSLSLSGAQVRFFIGSTLVRTFFVPQGAGNAWAVFDWDGQTLNAVNQLFPISGVPQPAIRAPGNVESNQEELQRLIGAQRLKSKQ